MATEAEMKAAYESERARAIAGYRKAMRAFVSTIMREMSPGGLVTFAGSKQKHGGVLRFGPDSGGINGGIRFDVTVSFSEVLTEAQALAEEADINEKLTSNVNINAPGYSE